MDIHAWLEDLERRLDPAIEEELETAWRNFLAGRHPEPFFAPRRARKSPPARPWPTIPVSDTQGPDAFDIMALDQLAGVSRALAEGGGGALGMRANYGVGILPSLFGTRIVAMDPALNLLPTSVPLAGGEDALRTLPAKGVPDPETGLGARVLGAGRRFGELLSGYPNLRRHVLVYHPDLQGPLDALELIWGSDFFVALYDEPERVHQILELVCDAYETFMRRWWTVAPPPDGALTTHWNLWHPGRIMLRDDSAMNLSPSMYRDFAAPWNERLLSRLGGGALHACGKVDHWLPETVHMPGLTAFHMTQPEYNDMETVFRHTVDRGLPLFNIPRRIAENAVAGGRALHGRVAVFD